MRKILVVAVVCLAAQLASGTATISGNLKDLTGTNVTSRTFVRFRLAGCSYQVKASGAALLTPYEKDFTPDTNGAISGTLFRNDTEISCLDQLDTTWYDVTVYRDGKPQKPTPYRVAAATFNLNTASSLTTTPVAAVRDAVVQNPAATQTISSHPLAFGSGSGLSATYQGSIQGAGTYLRSNGTTFAPVTAGTVAADVVASEATNGVLYWDGAGVSSTPTGGAGILCLISTDGGTPVFGSCSGTASTIWSQLTAPIANLSISMAQRTTTFTWGTGASTNTLFKFDGSSGNGSGPTLEVRAQPSAPAIAFYGGANPFNFSFANPAAGRTISWTDPGGTGTIPYLEKAQTWSALQTHSAGLTVSAGTVALGNDAIQTAEIQDAQVTTAKLAATANLRIIHYIQGADNAASVLADADDQATIFFNYFGATLTISEVRCESDTGSPTVNLQKDDGSPTDMLSSNITCSTGGATSSSFNSGENVLASTDRVDFKIVSAGGTAKRVSISIKATL